VISLLSQRDLQIAPSKSLTVQIAAQDAIARIEQF
jgi:hypothetical protein